MRKSGERSFWWVACAAALVAATLGLAAACKQVELASGWAADGVEVDGVNDEWIGAITYFEKQDVTVGLLNDEEFLYVSLLTSGSVGRQAMATGLTVWFDPDGAKTSGMASWRLYPDDAAAILLMLPLVTWEIADQKRSNRAFTNEF